MRIVIAEDDFLLREGLNLVLQGEGFEVVATVGGPEEFLAAVEEHRPEVAVVDVRMPPTHTDEGIKAAVAARRAHPGLAVLVLSAYVEQSFATDLLADGARSVGYLLKERVGRVDAFVEALHRVAKGGTAIDPEVVAQLFAQRRADDPVERLTPREKEVLAAPNFERVERWRSFAEARGRSVVELAIGWLLSHPEVGPVIAGASSPDQVRTNVAASTWRLTEEELSEVAALG